MSNNKLRKTITWIAQIMAFVMVFAMVMITPVNTAQADYTSEYDTISINPSLSVTTCNIPEGNKFTLTVKNIVEKSKYKWYSANPKIASVDQNGIVKGIKQGTTTVTCQIKSIKLTCKVIVTKAGLDNKTFENVNSAEIVADMGAGWNLGNQLEAVKDGKPGETNWGNPVITQKLIDSVKSAGFTTIRIPVSYFDYIGGAPNYRVDATWLGRVQQVVDYCIKDNLFVIINMHGDGYTTIPKSWLLCGEKDQTAIKAKYEAVWKQIASKFKDYDEHLIFESMNEEFDGSYNAPVKEHYQNINDYNQIFLDTVRQSGGNNDKRWVLIPGWNTSIDYTVGDYGFVLPIDQYLSSKVPEGQNRIMISAHYYAPWDFCGGENADKTQWGESAEDLSKVSTYGGQSNMADQFKSLYDAFISYGYPVVIGEYGSIDKSSADPKSTFYRAYFARKLCENSVKYGCVPCHWDNGVNGNYGFALFDRKTTKVTQPEIVAAIMNAYHPKTIKGTATGIKLDKTSINAVVAGDPVTLKDTLTGTKKDTVKWTSSDESIATVSDDGVVRAYKVGTVTVTASANGYKALCKVNCKDTDNVLVSLYALETKSWGAAKSPNNVEVKKEGGTYTLSLTASKDAISNIGALYIKDIQVENKTRKTSKYSSAKIKINSVKFNGINCTVTQAEPEEAVNKDSSALDFGILNQWSKTQNIKEAELGDTGSFKITAGEIKYMNTVEVSFTVSDIKVAIEQKPTTPAPPPPAPTAKYKDATINKIEYDFNITGVNTESTDFVITDINSKDYTQTIQLNGDGDYSVTFDLPDVSGIINLGYFKTDNKSTAVATLKKITINGKYECTKVDGMYPNQGSKVLKVNTSFDNGFRNIWNTSSVGTTAASNDDVTLFYSEKSNKSFILQVKEGK